MLWFFLAFSSALLSAAAAITQKKVLFKMPALEFSFVLAVINMLLSLPFLFGIDLAAVPLSGLLVLYGKTIIGTLAFLCVMLAIKNLEISGSLPLMALTPGLVAVSAFFILSEDLSITEIVGMALLIGGTYIIDTRKNNKMFEPFKVFFNSKNHRYILFALLLFTAASLLDKIILVKYHLKPLQFVGFQHIFLAFNFSILVLISKKNPFKFVSSLPKNLWKWIALISILTIGYRYTQIEAVKIAPVALVLTVKRFSVLFAAVIGGNVFKEQNLIRKGMAAAIIVLGAVLILQK